jgi:ribonuclease J
MQSQDHSSTRAVFWNGTHTIGGVQVMLRSPSAALLFDFGFTPNPSASLFSGVVRAPDDALIAYLRAGMAPLVEGLYGSDHLGHRSVAQLTERLRHGGRILEDQPLVDDLDELPKAVFFSHLHQDHMALLPFLSDDVTVFCHRDSEVFHAAMVAAGVLPACPARFVGLADGEQVEHGDIRLELVEVDHDVPGASGFLARLPDGSTVAWTGDWRLHGRHPSRMQRFAARCAAEDGVVLMTEGTSLGPDRSGATAGDALTEFDVDERFDDLLGDTSGLVTTAFYPRNLERIESFRRLAVSHGRRLVLSRPTAGGWLGAVQRGLAIGDPAQVLVVDDGSDDGAIDLPAITAEQISDDRAAFVCEVQIEHRSLLLGAASGPGDLYVHTNGNPLGTSGPAWGALQAWMQQTGTRFERLNSGGHAPPDGLEWLAKAAQPDLVVPVHSNHPELYPCAGTPSLLPHRGQVVDLHVRQAVAP